jgi:hypothetical protein
MASEWIELTDKERNELIYVNLAKARLILRPIGEGSEIWFLGGVREDGMVLVKESPEEVLALLDARNAPRH